MRHNVRMSRASIARQSGRRPRVEWLAPVGLLASIGLLFVSFPLSIWAASDYSLDSLSGAINLAYRLGDRTLYPAPSMGNHPGVPQYFVSWVSLALSGFPISTSDLGFFDEVLDNAERFRTIAIVLFTLFGAGGLYALARVAQEPRIPRLLLPLLCLVWFVSTPAAAISFTGLSIDAFGLLLTAWMVGALFGIARSPRIGSLAAVSAGGLAAASYLTKLSYIGLFFGLCAALAAAIASAPKDRRHNLTMSALFVLSATLTVLSFAFWFIEWSTFVSLLDFHRGVIFHSGLYGGGDPVPPGAVTMLHSLGDSLRDGAWSVPLTLAGGTASALWGIKQLFDRTARADAVFAIGAGVAGGFSALSTLTHYAPQYSAGTATTLPLLGLALFLLARRSGVPARSLMAAGLALAALMTVPTVHEVVRLSRERALRSQEAQADRVQLDELAAARSCLTVFAYHVPFREFGAAFLLKTSGVSRLVYAYLAEKRSAAGSPLQELVPRHACAFLIDRDYFRTADIARATSLLDGGAEPGDDVLALRTVFVLSRRGSLR